VARHVDQRAQESFPGVEFPISPEADTPQILQCRCLPVAPGKHRASAEPRQNPTDSNSRYLRGRGPDHHVFASPNDPAGACLWKCKAIVKLPAPGIALFCDRFFDDRADIGRRPAQGQCPSYIAERVKPVFSKPARPIAVDDTTPFAASTGISLSKTDKNKQTPKNAHATAPPAGPAHSSLACRATISVFSPRPFPRHTLPAEHLRQWNVFLRGFRRGLCVFRAGPTRKTIKITASFKSTARRQPPRPPLPPVIGPHNLGDGLSMPVLRAGLGVTANLRARSAKAAATTSRGLNDDPVGPSMWRTRPAGNIAFCRYLGPEMAGGPMTSLSSAWKESRRAFAD